MAYEDTFLNRVKHWDNRAAQWLQRHFYFFLFEVFLLIIFCAAFFNVIKIINIGFSIPKDNVTDQLLMSESLNSMLIVVLLILIALGLLNIINSNSRFRSILKNIEFNLSRRRSDQKPQD